MPRGTVIALVLALSASGSLALVGSAGAERMTSMSSVKRPVKPGCVKSSALKAKARSAAASGKAKGAVATTDAARASTSKAGARARARAKRRTRAACAPQRSKPATKQPAAGSIPVLAPPSPSPVTQTPPGQQPAPTTPGVSAAPPGVTTTAPVRSTVGADAYDLGTFVLRLTRNTVAAGDLTIYFRNRDASEHNLWLDPPEAGAPSILISDAVGENGGATKTVPVTPGTWRLYCSLLGHSSMTRDLTVQ